MLRRALLPALLLCAAGLLMAHHPMLPDGFGWVQTDLGDSRYNNYLVEHYFRWLVGDPAHRSFWDPPYFYPAKNISAYSDVLLGAAPFYWLFRLLRFAPDTAYQLWLVLLSALNFASMLALLRRLRFASWPAAAGAFLFAFGAPRIGQIGHVQLVAHFFTTGALAALVALLDEERAPRRRFAWHLAVLSGCLVGQVYTGFYLAWFLAFVLAMAGLLGLASASARRILARLVRTHWIELGVASLAVAACLAPLVLHYLAVLHDLGYRDFDEVVRTVPHLGDWLLPGEWSWIRLNWPFPAWPLPSPYPARPFVQTVSPGLLTGATAVFGLYAERRRPAVAWFAASGLVFVIAMSSIFGLTPWRWIYRAAPGAAAIRLIASGSLLLLVPLAIGIASLFQQMAGRGWIAVGLGAVMLFEQGITSPAYDKRQNRSDVANLARQVAPSCRVFFFNPEGLEQPIWRYQIDAIGAGLLTNIPTLNGYSGRVPPGWDLWDFAGGQEPEFRRRVAAWLRHEGALVDPASVCWVSAKIDRSSPRGVRRANDAECLAASVPDEMVAGREYSVSVTLENAGRTTWRTADSYALGASEPEDNLTWGRRWVLLPADVLPDRSVTFHFVVVAPEKPGRYRFSWRMLQVGVEWFGCPGPSRDIRVSAPP